MPKQIRAFYAYPHEPPDIGETIQATKEKLRSEGQLRQNNIGIKLWSDLNVSGKSLDHSILDQIDRNDIFACDLTYPNLNVSFELGYAIAKFKRIFTSLNPALANAVRQYKSVHFSLLRMGYSEYENRESLAKAFLQEKPWKSLEQTLLDKRFQQTMPRLERPTLVYVKPPGNSDSVLAVQETFEKTVFSGSVFVDNPDEHSSQSLEWYADRFLSADAVIIHLLSSLHAKESSHNIKASILAGLALGFNVRMAMLAHGPYEPPIDFARWLTVHETAEACAELTRKWLGEVGDGLSHRRKSRRSVGTSFSKRMDIRTLFLGDTVAEHEADRLYGYFVETGAFLQAMKGPFTLLVGRRGTGKTAILYAIDSEMRSTTGNHVTILKPVGYETHGLIQVLDEIRQRSERGFLIESLWKFLIYSEIASDVREKLLDRPIHQELTPNENTFLDYYEKNSDVLSPPFSQRLKRSVSSLEGVGKINDEEEQRLKISEHLHNSLISEIRQHLGAVLSSKNSLMVLIDGLDEPWAPGKHIDLLSELIGGLLEFAQDLPRDFRRSSSRVKPVNASITALLRSDIFASVKPLMSEEDKLPIGWVRWNDAEQLLRVLEERLLQGAPRQRTFDEVWSFLFPEEVDGMQCSEFILRTVLHRPRDLIHFVKTAVSTAIDRGHLKIMPQDLFTAREHYSQYAFDSMLKEDDPRRGLLERILYEFAGANTQLARDDIEIRFLLAGVNEDDFNLYLNLLCDLNFLGIESSTGYRYASHEAERHNLREIARKHSSSIGRREVFEINPAFHDVLQLE